MIRIFDSHLGKKVDFEPLNKGKAGIYLCGPTVYDCAHLGHGRSAVSFDVIRRYFLYRGYEVKFVSNYTDIDDKMIKRASEEGISVKELTQKIVPEYERDYGALGVMQADVQPYATAHIEEMIDLIRILKKKGFTYVLDDGVYFDVSRFEQYGRFSGQNLEELDMGARVAVKESKRNPHDFVLWKFEKPAEPYDDYWDSPWGRGRPGWHIECSAMARKHLGDTFDIHGGGLDLKFPHHECEVAQSQGALGMDTFARHWLHNGFIQVDNEKMSKSLGNFFTLKDIFAKYDPKVVRFMFIQTHYRNPINFSDVLLEQAKAALQRIHDFIRKLLLISQESGLVSVNVQNLVTATQSDFENFMDDDFDTSGALGVLFDFIKQANILLDNHQISKADVLYIREFLEKIDGILGVIFYEEITLEEHEQYLIDQREQARKEENFKRADEIRDELLKNGIELEDTPKGTIWKRV